MDYTLSLIKLWHAIQIAYENMRSVLFVTMAGDTDLPIILQAIGIAFLTILIPVAIAIFSDTKEFEILDKNVILDHVIKARPLLIYLALIFLPFIFWNGSRLLLRCLEIIFWAVGVYFMRRILVNSYHWMKGNKFILRFDYLKNLQNVKDMEASWRSVWQTEKINPQNEQELFKLFSSTINQLLTSDERKS